MQKPQSRRLARALVTVATAFIPACANVAPGLGSDASAARATNEGLFGGIASRFTNPMREPDVRTSRRLITRSILTPSRVFMDTLAWGRLPPSSERSIAWRGIAEQSRYRFTTEGAALAPTLAGEGRHRIALRRVRNDEFEWRATADYGIGATAPASMALIPSAWLAAAERPDTAAIRADLHAAFASSAREWGRVFSVKRFDVRRDAAGAWTHRHVFTLHPERAARTHPRFAKWLSDYVSPLRIRLRVHDGSHTWFDALVRDDSLVVRVRTRDGHLVPLEGGDAQLPDSLTLETDLSARLLFMRVGFRALRADFITLHDADETGWLMRFRREPAWQLPPLTERMIRSPLRRPFAQEGTTFRIVARRDSTLPQTVLARTIVVPVQESAILRFLARLANSGVDSYVDGADRETNQWFASAFGALRDDIRALLGPNATAPSR